MKLTTDLLNKYIVKHNLDNYHNTHNVIKFKTLKPNMINNATKIKIHKSYIAKNEGSEYWVAAVPKSDGSYDILYIRKSDHFGTFTPRGSDTKTWTLDGKDYQVVYNTDKRKVGYVKIGNVKPKNIDMTVDTHDVDVVRLMDDIRVKEIGLRNKLIINNEYAQYISPYRNSKKYELHKKFIGRARPGSKLYNDRKLELNKYLSKSKKVYDKAYAPIKSMYYKFYKLTGKNFDLSDYMDAKSFKQKTYLGYNI